MGNWLWLHHQENVPGTLNGANFYVHSRKNEGQLKESPSKFNGTVKMVWVENVYSFKFDAEAGYDNRTLVGNPLAE